MAQQGYWNGNKFVLLPIPQQTPQTPPMAPVPGMPTPQPFVQGNDAGMGGGRDGGNNATGGGVPGPQDGISNASLTNGALSLAGMANPVLGLASLANRGSQALFGQSLGSSIFGDSQQGYNPVGQSPIGYQWAGTNPDGGTYTGDFRGNPTGTEYAFNGTDYAPIDRAVAEGGEAVTGEAGEGTSRGEGGSFGYANGGTVNRLSGPNPPGPDDGKANLQRGEYVVRKTPSVKFRGLLEAINSGETDRKTLKGLL